MQKQRQIIIMILVLGIVGSVYFISIQRKTIVELESIVDQQVEELGRLQTTVYKMNKTLNQYNISLTILEDDPIVKAASIIISHVGLEYFNQYFYDPVSRIPEYDPNATHVIYKYKLQVGNYSTEEDVFFRFYSDRVRYHGIPSEDNLLPYTVTIDEAERLAVKAGLFDSPYPMDSWIMWGGPADYSPLSGHEERYIWYVKAWEDPPWASHRRKQVAYVDPISGRVYAIRLGGTVFSEDDVDTYEEASFLGVDGYIKLDYFGLPKRINLTESTNMTFTIRFSHISYIENRPDAKITIDPINNETYWIPTRTRDKLRDYLTYEPSGNITLAVGETVNVTCTLIVHDLDEEFSFKRRTLKGIGIGTEKTLIVSNLDE